MEPKRAYRDAGEKRDYLNDLRKNVEQKSIKPPFRVYEGSTGTARNEGSLEQNLPRTEDLPLQEQQLKRLEEIFNGLSEERKAEFMTLAENFAAAAHAPPQPEKALSALPELPPGFRPPPKTQADLLEAYGIPLYVKRTDAYEHLKTHYGPWLKHFTPELEHDHLYQYQLKTLDPDLYIALRNMLARKARSDLKDVKMRDIISVKKQEIDTELYTTSQEEMQKAIRLANAMSRRQYSYTPQASP